MAENNADYIAKRLAPGYHLASIGSHSYSVIDPDGNLLFDGTLAVVVTEGGDPHNRQNMLAQLRRLGAIKEPQKREPKPERTGKHRDFGRPKNPVLLAREILADPQASPRERSMAKEYLRVLEYYVAYKKQMEADSPDAPEEEPESQ